MILYFSGTGNSADVATRLASLTADTAIPLTTATTALPTLSAPARVVWVFPVHCWGVPPFVLSIIDTISVPDRTVPHHLVLTCGDDCGLADRMWRSAMARRGLPTLGAFTVIMPNTYIPLPGFDVDPPALRDSKLASSVGRVASIASLLPHLESAALTHTDVKRGATPWLKTRIIYPPFMRWAVKPSRFKVSDACTGCGRCSRICPMANITIAGRHPSWGPDCTGCLACYHACPAHAISYGPTASKGQYLNPRYLNNTQSPSAPECS